MKSLVVTCFASLLVILAACTSSSGDSVQTGNGVDDLSVACEERQGWPKDDQTCSLCKSAVLTAHCDCSQLKDFSGECLDQETAWKKSCDDAVNTCVIACEDDCTCLAGCYANNAACKKAADARDGCMTAYCATYCKPAN